LPGWLLNQLDLSGFAWRAKNLFWDELDIRKKGLYVKKKRQALIADEIKCVSLKFPLGDYE
jgi:hypothetical protein